MNKRFRVVPAPFPPTPNLAPLRPDEVVEFANGMAALRYARCRWQVFFGSLRAALEAAKLSYDRDLTLIG
jgi:hypothetical protein